MEEVQEIKQEVKPIKKKNSIIEFLRFFFAFDVIKNHGYFMYHGPILSPARIAVEFFFVLSGYLFVSFLERTKEDKIFPSILKMYKTKGLALGIPLLVCLICNLVYTIVVYPEAGISIIGYMWYVHEMLIVFAVYIILRHLIKKDKVFLIVIGAIGLVASIIHVFPFFYSWGYFRALSAISIGVLVKYIPKLPKKYMWISIVGFFIAFGYALRMLCMPFTLVEEEILFLIAYPSLIYFAFNLPLSFKPFDYLGSISFGMYAYQAIPRMHEVLGYTNDWSAFLIIMGCSIIVPFIVKGVKALYTHLKTPKIITNEDNNNNIPNE